MRNYTIDELAGMIVDTILEEQFLNREVLVPKVRAIVKTAVDLKNIPKDYNQYESKTDRARRLRTIEQKDCEIKFWLNIVKELDGANIDKYYKQQHAMLVTKGYKEPDAKI